MRPSAADLLAAALRSARVAAALCLVLLPVALLANYWVVTSSPEPLIEALAVAIDPPTPAGIETTSNEQPGKAETRPLLLQSVESFNDCLIPLTSLLDDGTTAELTVSAQRIYSLSQPQRPCRALAQRVHTGAIDETEFRSVFYHQYWNGNRLPVRLLVPLLGVAGYRTLLRLLSYGALVVALIGGLSRLRQSFRSSGAAELQTELLFCSLAGLLATLVLLCCFDLHQRAASFASAVAMMPCLWLWAYWQFYPPRATEQRKLTIIAGATGCWVAYFSLLTGAILLGVLLLTSAAALAPAPDGAERQGRALTLIVLLSAFCCGVVGFLFVHVAVASVVFEANIFGHFADQLMFRIDGSGRSTMPGSLNELYGDHEVSVQLLWQRLGKQLGVLAFGSLTLGRWLFFASGLIGIPGILYLALSLRRQRDPWRSVALILSTLAVPLWGLLLLEHTQVHVRLMGRFLAWPIASALILLLMLAVPRFRHHHWSDD